MTTNGPIRIEGKPALSMAESARYLGVSATALNNKLKKRLDIKKYRGEFGQQRYLLIEDLDRLKQAKPME